MLKMMLATGATALALNCPIPDLGPNPAMDPPLSGKVLPKDSESETWEVPPGMFLTPCMEDEIPTIVEDSERALPQGVWYICIHRDEYGEVMDSGWYLWDDEEGHLINE